MNRFIFGVAISALLAASVWCQKTTPQDPMTEGTQNALQAPAQASSANPSLPKEPGYSITYSCVLQVEEIDRTLAALISKADSLGGWFTNRSKTSLVLKVPTSASDSMVASIASLGIPMDRNLQTVQLEPQRNELLSRLKARRATLEDYFAMLKESSDSTVFTIEREIVRLQAEIDQTTGQVQKLEDQMAFAVMTVYFRFQERTAPVATGQSRFKWLNRLELPTFMGGFDYEAR